MLSQQHPSFIHNYSQRLSSSAYHNIFQLLLSELKPFLNAGTQTLVLAIQYPVEIAVVHRWIFFSCWQGSRRAGVLFISPPQKYAQHLPGTRKCYSSMLSFCDEPAWSKCCLFLCHECWDNMYWWQDMASEHIPPEGSRVLFHGKL